MVACRFIFAVFPGSFHDHIPIQTRMRLCQLPEYKSSLMVLPVGHQMISGTDPLFMGCRKMQSADVNGVRVFGFTSREALIDYAAAEKKSLIAINAEKILHATDQTRTLINENIGYADGIGAVMALKKKGLAGVVKIPGCELWLDIVRRLYRTKSLYLVGAKEEVIAKTVEKLRKEFPGINILGYRNGYIKSDEEKRELIETIATLKPDIVFVAMGSPKQELLMQEMQQRHPALYQGLGGSFDVYVGNVKRAPKWWVEHNLEWAYRLVKEPTRIRRQIHLVSFLALLNFSKI